MLTLSQFLALAEVFDRDTAAERFNLSPEDFADHVVAFGDLGHIYSDDGETFHVDIGNCGWTGSRDVIARRLYTDFYLGAATEDELHAFAAAFMATRPDLPTMSLDEWLVEHRAHLSGVELEDAIALSTAF